MNVLVLSGLAWSQHRAASEALLQRMARQPLQATAVLDFATVQREAAAPAAPAGGAPLPCAVARFADWLQPAGHSEVGVLNGHLVRGLGPSVPADHLVLVDARAQHADLIGAALGHLRQSWFPLDDWHPAFVMVVDDAHLLSIGQRMAHTFYCEPRLLTDTEVNRLVRQTLRRARAMRWLGPGFIRWQRSVFYRVLDRYANWVERREERQERRG